MARRNPSVFIVSLFTLLLTSIAPVAEAQDAPAATTTQVARAQAPTVADAEEEVKSTSPFFSALAHNFVDDVKHIPRRNSLYWILGGAAGAALIHPYDGRINRYFMENGGANDIFQAGKFIGSTGVLLGAATTTYIVGRAGTKPRVAHLGMDEIEAVLLAEGLAQTTKVIFRRDRPTNPDGSREGGFSFPSGHATVTFAAASVLQQHLGYKAGVPTYLLATYVAMSRLQDNRHYASDVMMGAALGVVVGRSVTYHGRNFWAGPVFVPGGIELAFVYHK